MRRFGVEIEMTNISTDRAARAIREAGIPCEAEGYNHTTRNHWKVVTDASCGTEVVSPVLEGEDGLAQVTKVARALENADAKITKSCGLHVHIDARRLPIETIRATILKYKRFEGEIDAFLPPSRRANNNHYCKSLTRVADERITRATTMREMQDAFYGDRYYKVNVQSYARHGTIEFRHHSGTVDATKITNWIRFLQAFVENASTTMAARATTRRGISTPRPGTKTAKVMEIVQNGGGWEEIARRLGESEKNARLWVRHAHWRMAQAQTTPAAATTQTTRDDGLYAGCSDEIRAYYRARSTRLARRAA